MFGGNGLLPFGNGCELFVELYISVTVRLFEGLAKILIVEIDPEG